MIRILFVLLSLLFIDQGSKWATWHYLPRMQGYSRFPFGGETLFQDLLGIDAALVNHANKGAAFGLFSGHQELLLSFRIALVGAIFVWLLVLNKRRAYTLPVALIASGALSNILDYFFYGHVVDMFYVRLWSFDYPVFNVADSAICIGTAWLIIRMLKEKKA